jgi:hypothetical protein
VKRDKILYFQCLLSVVIIALAGLIALGLLAKVRLSQQSKMGPLEASRNLIFADHAEWNQFYEAVGANAEVPAVREQRAADHVVNVPITMSADEAPASAKIAPVATTTSPVVPHSASSELAAKPDASSPQTAALPDRPHEKANNAAGPNEPIRDQDPWKAAPSVAVSESTPPAVADPPVTALVPALDANADKSMERMTPPAATPAPRPQAKAAVPVRRVHRVAPVKQAIPEPERKPERNRLSIPSRARVALRRQRYAPRSYEPQWNGTQWVDPQHSGPPWHQSGALSYASPQYSAKQPSGPQFGPYFPYGSRPPSTQRARAQQYRSPQPLNPPSYDPRQFAPKKIAPREPARSFNDPYSWH